MPGTTRHKFTVLDVFSGCGGFSLGFSRAGFEILGGIEIDPVAQRTHSRHFPPMVEPDAPSDIQQVDTAQVTKPLGSLYPGDDKVRFDVVIGGPPCQPFTRVGRAKLREVAGNVRAHIEDKRVPLFAHCLRFVADLKLLAFVMENVHHLASFAGRNIAEEVAAEGLGYNVRYAILNSASYSVLQMGERFGTDSYSHIHLTPPTGVAFRCAR